MRSPKRIDEPSLLRPLLFLVTVFAVTGLVAPAPQAPAPLPSELKESIEVRLVTVDVVALDADDATVPNLSKRDFRLFVDGKPAAIDTLDIDCGSGAVPDPKSRQLGGWQASRDLPVGTRRVVLAFDYLHLPAAVCPDAELSASADGRPTPCLLHTKALQEFQRVLEAKTGIADEEMMVVALDGGLRVEQPFTTDRQAVIGALHRMENDPSLWANDRIHFTEKPLFDSLRTLVTVLRATPGPKAVVFVTAGSGPGNRHDLDFEELSAGANDAKVSFFPVDCFGVYSGIHARFRPT
jgi:hypothetical protein